MNFGNEEIAGGFHKNTLAYANAEFIGKIKASVETLKRKGESKPPIIFIDLDNFDIFNLTFETMNSDIIAMLDLIGKVRGEVNFVTSTIPQDIINRMQKILSKFRKTSKIHFVDINKRFEWLIRAMDLGELNVTKNSNKWLVTDNTYDVAIVQYIYSYGAQAMIPKDGSLLYPLADLAYMGSVKSLIFSTATIAALNNFGACYDLMLKKWGTKEPQVSREFEFNIEVLLIMIESRGWDRIQNEFLDTTLTTTQEKSVIEVDILDYLDENSCEDENLLGYSDINELISNITVHSFYELTSNWLGTEEVLQEICGNQFNYYYFDGLAGMEIRVDNFRGFSVYAIAKLLHAILYNVNNMNWCTKKITTTNPEIYKQLKEVMFYHEDIIHFIEDEDE